MSKYVPDVISHRWVIIASQRLARPEDPQSKAKSSKLKDSTKGRSPSGRKKCIFCEKNEALSDQEVFRVGKGEVNTPGWKVRVVSNKYPITDYHEVIIHSPLHEKNIEELSEKQIGLILRAYKARFNYYRKMGRVLIFCNSGEQAGASITHPHSQLVVIPGQINLDTLAKEPLNNVVQDTKYFTVYCPDFSQWPYEVWIAPKEGKARFGDLGDEVLDEMAGLMKQTLKQLKKIFDGQKLTDIDFAYNYYIYPGHEWYLRIIPRFIHRAGFELGTGLNVNIVDPAEASLELRGIESKIVGILNKLKMKAKG
jgi:UDPglucose--hexose-1-phosphate uridylyltransferase